METRINAFEKGQKALSTLFAITAYIKKSGLEKSLLDLVDFRVSQINSCAYCLDMHSKEALATGETPQRLFGLSAWRETPYYTSRERAALAWTEAVKACQVHDDVYAVAKNEFSDEELIDLTLVITTINTWNRFNFAFPNTQGTYRVGQFG